MAGESLSPAAAVKLSKAENFMTVAEVAESSEFYDAAVSLAVSAGVNYCDALCIVVLGKYPRSANHEEIFDLLRRCGQVGDSVARHQRKLLKNKTKAQYSTQECSAREAAEAMQHAERIATAVLKEIGMSSGGR